MRPKVLFLDFDGTLVDSLGVLYDFYIEFLAGYGVEGCREEFDRLNGASGWEIISTLKKCHGIRVPTVLLMMKNGSRLMALYRSKVRLFPGTRSFLERMWKAGIDLVLVTSANRPLVDAWMKTDKEVRSWFRDVVTPEGLKQSKPHPDIYLRALDVAKVAPEEALIIEDAPHGLSAGVAAGISTIALLREGTLPFEIPAGVLGKVSSWEELEDTFLSSVRC